MLSLAWFNTKNNINQISKQIWFWYLSQCNTIKAQSRMCNCVDLPEPSLLPYIKNKCRFRFKPVFNPTVSALAHIWYKYQVFMCCSKSSVEHLYLLIKTYIFFILWQWNWYFCYRQIINLWRDSKYLVYYIIHNT